MRICIRNERGVNMGIVAGIILIRALYYLKALNDE